MIIIKNLLNIIKIELCYVRINIITGGEDVVSMSFMLIIGFLALSGIIALIFGFILNKRS